MGGGKTWISVRCVVLEHMCRTRVRALVFCVTGLCACQTLVLLRHSGSRLRHIGTRALRPSLWHAWHACGSPSRALTTLRKNYREKESTSCVLLSRPVGKARSETVLFNRQSLGSRLHWPGGHCGKCLAFRSG